MRLRLAVLATLAALFPMGAAAATGPATIDINTTVDTLFASIPEGATVQAFLAGAGSNGDVCEAALYHHPLVVAGQFGGTIQCSGAVHIHAQAWACDDR